MDSKESTLFVEGETYTQFTVSIAGWHVDDRWLYATEVFWVPSHLISGDFAALLGVDEINRDEEEEYGVYNKSWVLALRRLCDVHKEVCIVLEGRGLHGASGCHTTIDKQYFSCDTN